MKQKLIFVLSLMFILMQVLGGLTVGLANTNLKDGDIVIRTKGANIVFYEGASTPKTVTLIVTPQQGKTIKNLYITIDENSDFYIPSNQDQFIKIDGNIEAEKERSIQLMCKGSGNKLVLNLSYEKIGEEGKGELCSTTTTLYFHVTSKNTDPPILDPDTSSKKPLLGISSDMKMPTGKSGSGVRIPISIENRSSLHIAKDIIVSIENEEGSNVIIFDTIKPIQSIKLLGTNQSETVYFSGDVNPNIASGIYRLKLNISYRNIYGDSYEVSDTVSIKIESTNTMPKLVIAKTETIPQVIKPGEGAKLKVHVRNAGTLSARDIKVSLDGLKGDAFMVQGGSSIKVINQMAGNGVGVVEFDIISSSSIPEGYQELDVNIDYKPEGGGEGLKENQKIFIPVAKTGKLDAVGGGANIVIENVKSPGGSISPNKDFRISFNVKNNGKGDARNIKIVLDTGDNIVTKTLNTIIIPNLKAGESRPINFTLFATSEAATGSHPIAINTEYEGAAGAEGKGNAMQYIGVFVENPDKKGDGDDEEGKSTPRLIIDQYVLSEPEVKAGQKVDVDLSFLNTSNTINIKNLKVSFMSEDGVFTTEGSNSFFVDSVSPGSSFKKDIGVHVKPDAEPKIYNLAVNLEYEDDKGNPFETKEFISIPVIQDARLMLGDLNLSPENHVSQPIPLYIEFYNMGKATLYNLMIRVEGDFDGNKPSYFVGNFESGRSDSFDANIMTDTPGELHGKIIFTFEDSSGNETELIEEFTIDVMEMPPDMDEFDDSMMPSEDEKISKKTIWGWIIGGAGAAIVVFILFRRWRNKKDGEMFNESL